jgi:peptidoglycan/xylan/chitin deacetylase (PgdA/CDA1 family)
MHIVAFHNVLEHRPSAFNMLARRDWLLAEKFAEQIDWLRSHFKIVGLRDIADAVRDGRHLDSACALTFDDGYASAYELAAGLLDDLSIPATFFLITNHLREDRTEAYDFFDECEALLYLTDRKAFDLSPFGVGFVSLACDACKLKALRRISRAGRSLPRLERDRLRDELRGQLGVSESSQRAYLGQRSFQMMNAAQACDLVGRGHDVGSHTRSHTALRGISEEEMVAEVGESSADLQEVTGQPPYAFAYPFGKREDFSEAAVDAVRKAGYRCAVTMVAGDNDNIGDPFQLRRVTFKALQGAGAVVSTG